MLSDLTAVSTYGWYSSSGSADSLTAISTFGWYGFEELIANPDIIQFMLHVNRMVEIELYR
tara:strand:+ start:89 stop:271 length:183 start_codon:yes stop_codon:yes gene_type:complete